VDCKLSCCWSQVCLLSCVPNMVTPKSNWLFFVLWIISLKIFTNIHNFATNSNGRTDQQTNDQRWKHNLLVHKALVGHAPQYIADLIRLVTDLPSWASLRTALSGDLYVPRTRRRFGDRAFAIVVPLCVEYSTYWHQTPPVDDNCLKTVLFNWGFAEYM